MTINTNTESSNDYFSFRHNHVHEYLLCLKELDSIEN